MVEGDGWGRTDWGCDDNGCEIGFGRGYYFFTYAGFGAVVNTFVSNKLFCGCCCCCCCTGGVTEPNKLIFCSPCCPNNDPVPAVFKLGNNDDFSYFFN